MVQFQETVTFKNKNQFLLKQYPDYGFAISRFDDYIKRVTHNQKIVETRFLNTIEQLILQKMCHQQCNIIFDGGYGEAQYKKACLFPMYLEYCFPKFKVLKTKFSSKFHTIEHRHILGKILNLGIERESVGDIVINENQIYVVCDNSVSEMIIGIQSIQRVPIKFEEYNGLIFFEKKFEEFEKIVSSLRIDTIVAAITKNARSTALEILKAGNVKVNYQTIYDKSETINIGDEIVIRKYGKFQLSEIKNKTKKENLVLKFKKYI